mgnify:CR=1 FL=1
MLGTEFRFTQDATEFSFHSGPKFNYSETPLGNEVFFFASRLLFEKGIKEQHVSVFDWENTKAMFATHPKYSLPFDPFAAIFYLLSRYEEYLPHRRDVHGRFEAQDSLAYQKGFLQKPVVDIYVKKVAGILKGVFPDLEFKERKFEFVSTIDIDNAWAFREKGLIRTSGALLRSLFTMKFSELSDRLLVLAGQRKDPFDTYDEIFSLQKKYKFRQIFFFLLGDYGMNDKNVSVSRRNFQSLIKHIADYYEVGIHPSYGSLANPQKVRLEQSRLQKVIRREVKRSRQHFLRLEFPHTYRNLIDCDITDDYTMGYASQPGFRAGTCSTFYFYDLEYDKPTMLRVHPFAVMDATLNLYMKIQPGESMGFVWPLIKEVKEVGGTFTVLWHNESLSERPPWEGWKNVYLDIIKAAQDQK